MTTTTSMKISETKRIWMTSPLMKSQKALD
jgi:hypothetical protein